MMLLWLVSRRGPQNIWCVLLQLSSGKNCRIKHVLTSVSKWRIFCHSSNQQPCEFWWFSSVATYAISACGYGLEKTVHWVSMLTTASTHPAVPSTKLSTSPRYFTASVGHKCINEQSRGAAEGGGNKWGDIFGQEGWRGGKFWEKWIFK